MIVGLQNHEATCSTVVLPRRNETNAIESSLLQICGLVDCLGEYGLAGRDDGSIGRSPACTPLWLHGQRSASLPFALSLCYLRCLSVSFVSFARRLLPLGLRSWLVARRRDHRLQWNRAGSVDLGQLRRLTPISPIFGIDRGLPVDRYYIEKFLQENAAMIRGRTLELGDPTYIKKFGGAGVTRIDVLHVAAGNPAATIVADLTDAGHIEAELFDCIILTQSLQMIYDFKAALRTLFRILRPGGTLLLTTHGITKIARRLGRDDWGEYWHFTTQSAEAVFAETFPGAAVKVTPWGNVLAATAYLHELAAEELTRKELDHLDPDFEVIVSVRARKPAAAPTGQ